MLRPGARVLDFDGGVTAQLKCGLPAPGCIVDLGDVGCDARLWANAAQRERIRASLCPEDSARVTFIGSGDYHFVSALLLEQFRTPLSVVVFDHHPDWERLPPRYGCGAWINRALEHPTVQCILHVGAGSTDLDFPARLTGNRAAVRSGRLRLVPAADLGSDPVSHFQAALAALPTGPVYLSVDKDCLRAAHALTNWEEGRLELEPLLACLAVLRATRDLVGADITGDYSPPEFRSRFKAWCARWDHPADYTAHGHSPEEIARVNAATNARLLSVLTPACLD